VSEFQARSAQREKAFVEREAKLVTLQTQLDKGRETLDQEIERRVQAKADQLRAQARKQAETGLELQLQDLRVELGEKEQKLAEATKAELELRKRQRELDSRQQTLELELARRMDEEREKIRQDAARAAAEEQHLRLSEKEKLIGELQKEIEALKQKAQQGSLRLQGEVLELEVESLLKQKFFSDEIVPISNGVRGADLLHRVRTASGLTCGTIIWETKRTRNWMQSWIADASFALALAINWVEAKILNSRRVLQRLAANREELEITPHLLALGQLAQNCQEASSLDTLRGYEGTAAGRYFECYAGFFPEHAPFERRSRRPPHNAPNAVLSYAYTLLSAEAEACLHAIGLDPAIGFLHEPADRRPSLALDIIEPFRAPLADAMALDLLTHSVLNPHAHFENRNGGVYLNLEGRKRFFVAYERRMEREFTSEQHGSRTSLRNELHNQCRAVKKAVTEDEPFEPFLMN